MLTGKKNYGGKKILLKNQNLVEKMSVEKNVSEQISSCLVWLGRVWSGLVVFQCNKRTSKD